MLGVHLLPVVWGEEVAWPERGARGGEVHRNILPLDLSSEDMRDPQLPLERGLKRAELLTKGQDFRNAQVDVGKTCLWRSWDIFVGMLKAKTNRKVPEIADLRAPPVLKNLKLSTGWDIAFEVDQQSVCFLSLRAFLQVLVSDWAQAWTACHYRAGTCTEGQGDHWSPWKPPPRSFPHTELLDKVVEKNWNAPQIFYNFISHSGLSAVWSI